jgi:hypothetical protein
MLVGRWTRLAALFMVPFAVLLAACHSSRSTSSTPGIGQKVIDGEFAFVVPKVDTSPTFDHTHAQGRVSGRIDGGPECRQRVAVGSDAQRLKDSTGRTYSARFMDPPRIGDIGDSIDSGLQVKVELAFDVPDANPTEIVLHDSSSSPGAVVSLKPPPTSSPSSRGPVSG